MVTSASISRPWAPSQTVAAIERAADVLLYFSSNGGSNLKISDIARGMNLPKGSVARVLQSLLPCGLIEQDRATQTYSLGPSALVVGATALRRVDVRTMIADTLRQLSRSTNETAALSRRVGLNSVYLDQVTPSRSVIMSVPIGVPSPLHIGGPSKVFLASLDKTDLAAYFDASSVANLLTRNARARLLDELQVIRERGWYEAAAPEPTEGTCIAVPVTGGGGAVESVLAVCGPASRLQGRAEDLARSLLRSARELSRAYNYGTDRSMTSTAH